MSLGIIRILSIALGLLVAITIHEFSHAFVARRLGDPTAERMGRLSLNPLVHLDPLGTLMMALTAITGFGIGWGKPTPVSSWNLRPGRRVGMAMVAAGGPLSNFVVALLLTTALRLVPFWPVAVAQVLVGIAVLNLSLAAFNVLPLPMLDGFHILMGVITSIRARWAYGLAYQLERIEPQGPMVLLILILAGYVFRFNFLSLLTFPIFRFLVSIVGLG